MTNILATITFVIATNWITTSVTRDVCDRVGCTVMHGETANQIGARITNTVATVVWKGKTNQFVLESTDPWYSDDLKREVARFGPNLSLKNLNLFIGTRN